MCYIYIKECIIYILYLLKRIIQFKNNTMNYMKHIPVIDIIVNVNLYIIIRVIYLKKNLNIE